MSIRFHRSNRSRTGRAARQTPTSIFDGTIRLPNSSQYNRALADCLLRFPSGRIT